MIFHIAYACDDRYVQQTAVSMVSLLENNRGHKILIYLIEDQMEGRNLAELSKLAQNYGSTLFAVPLDSLLQGIFLGDGGRHPNTIYAKLFLDQICEADRILYLDSDTVIADTLLPLWEIDMEDMCAAGVKMPYAAGIKEKLGLEADDPYVCDGVVLINLEQWRKGHFRNKSIEYIANKDGNPWMLSEGVLNYVCRKHIKELSPAYNLMSGMLLWSGSQIAGLYGTDDYYSDADIKTAREHPVVIHYLNELYIRPWFANSDHPYQKEYLFYRKKAGAAQAMPVGRMAFRTRVLRFLNSCLPFEIFQKIYRLIKKHAGAAE